LRIPWETSVQAARLFLFAIGFILTLPSVTLLIFEPSNPGVFLALPGLLCLVAGGCLLLPRRIYTQWHIYLCESGFLYEKGQVRQAFRWDQIESIRGSASYNPQSGKTFLIYKVRRLDGYEVKLNNAFSEIVQFIDILLEKFSRQVASRGLNMVPPRDRTFADFTLDRQGIRDKQGVLSWQEIQELTIEHGTMAVLKRKTKCFDHELEADER
jgi:hypothetical protein